MISKCVTVASSSRAEAERATTFAQPPQLDPAPTMAMSLKQPLTVKAPAEEGAPEQADPPVTPDRSGEHAAELTPNAALVDPIGGLTMETDTETFLPSHTRRASMSAVSPPAEISPCSRHKSALQ